VQSNLASAGYLHEFWETFDLIISRRCNF